MKRFSLLLLGIAVSLSALCQTEKHLTGTVKNAKGQNIEYVTVEVKDRDIRTISDAHGNFSVKIPDGNSSKLIFSHVSYSPKTVDISDIADKGHLNVMMEPSEYMLHDFAVIGKKMKEKTLKHKGLRLPGEAAYEGLDNIGLEIGVFVNPEHDFHVKNVNLDVKKCTYSKCTLSINMYEIVGKDSLINILHKPIYSVIEKSQVKQSIVFQPQEQLYFTHGKRYYVSMEIVDIQSNGMIVFPIYLKECYLRAPELSKIEKIPINIGLSIKGYEYKTPVKETIN